MIVPLIIGVGVLLMGSKTSSNDGLDFNFCVDEILKKEGGYVNDPRDPGGETKYGISKRSYPNVDIKNLTLDQAKAIYKRDYFDKLGAIKSHLNLVAFDCAVNQGLGYARTVLNELSTMTMSADKEVNHFCARREQRYRANKNFNIYGKGWLNRLADVKKLSLEALS